MMERRRSRMARKRFGLMGAAGALLGLCHPPPAAAEAPRGATTARPGEDDAVRRYWTEQRLREAQPLFPQTDQPPPRRPAPGRRTEPRREP